MKIRENRHKSEELKERKRGKSKENQRGKLWCARMWEVKEAFEKKKSDITDTEEGKMVQDSKELFKEERKTE